jgi:predicted RNA-binding protein with PIN domain
LDECHEFVVDGYNLIHSIPELSQLVVQDAEGARIELTDVLASYTEYLGRDVILVFDGKGLHFPEGRVGSHLQIIYSGDAGTADSYIVESVRGKTSKPCVVTSDLPLANTVRAIGCNVISTALFWEEVKSVGGKIRSLSNVNTPGYTKKLFGLMDPDIFSQLEQMRIKQEEVEEKEENTDGS